MNGFTYYVPTQAEIQALENLRVLFAQWDVINNTVKRDAPKWSTFFNQGIYSSGGAPLSGVNIPNSDKIAEKISQYVPTFPSAIKNDYLKRYFNDTSSQSVTRIDNLKNWVLGAIKDYVAATSTDWKKANDEYQNYLNMLQAKEKDAQETAIGHEESQAALDLKAQAVKLQALLTENAPIILTVAAIAIILVTLVITYIRRKKS